MHANDERIKNDLFIQYIAIKSICRSSHMRIINFYYRFVFLCVFNECVYKENYFFYYSLSY